MIADALVVAPLIAVAQVDQGMIQNLFLFHIVVPLVIPPVVGHICGWSMRPVGVLPATFVGIGMGVLAVIANFLWFVISANANSEFLWTGDGGMFLIPSLMTIGFIVATLVVCARMNKAQPSRENMSGPTTI